MDGPVWARAVKLVDAVVTSGPRIGTDNWSRTYRCATTAEPLVPERTLKWKQPLLVEIVDRRSQDAAIFYPKSIEWLSVASCDVKLLSGSRTWTDRSDSTGESEPEHLRFDVGRYSRARPVKVLRRLKLDTRHIKTLSETARYERLRRGSAKPCCARSRMPPSVWMTLSSVGPNVRSIVSCVRRA